MGFRRLLLPILAATASLGGCGADADPRPAAPADPRAALVGALRDGGHVLVVRHTTTESATDRVETLGDCGTQRNLNAQGRKEARDLGAAVRALRVPVGDVRTSPLCRATETAELAFTRATQDRGLVSPGVIGTEAGDRARTRALQRAVDRPPAAGTNTVLVTHTGNIGDAFALSVLEGEALVFRPGGAAARAEPPRPVGRLALRDWARLRAAR